MILAHSGLSTSLQHPRHGQQHLLYVKTKEWEMDPQVTSSGSTYNKSALGLYSTAPTKLLHCGWGPGKFCSLVLPPKMKGNWSTQGSQLSMQCCCHDSTVMQLWHIHMQSLLWECSSTRMWITTLKYISSNMKHKFKAQTKSTSIF